MISIEVTVKQNGVNSLSYISRTSFVTKRKTKGIEWRSYTTFFTNFLLKSSTMKRVTGDLIFLTENYQNFN